MDEQQKTLKYLVRVERLAEQILSERREVVALDKRRNENREALRELRGGGGRGEKRCWVTVGSVLVRLAAQEASELLEKDQKQLDVDVNKLRSDLKVKVNQLRDLEMRPPVPGLGLKPMTERDMYGLASAGLLPR